MKRRLFAIAGAAALLAGPAMSADLPSRAPPPVFVPPPPIFTWTGFYAGVNAGGIVRADSGRITNPARIREAVNFRDTGIEAGGQAGYNWQTSNLVFGVEGDFQGTDLPNTKKTNPNRIFTVVKDSLFWFGTARGRVGFAWDRWLFYGTGGLAFAHTDVKLSTNVAGGLNGARADINSGGPPAPGSSMPSTATGASNWKGCTTTSAAKRSSPGVRGAPSPRLSEMRRRDSSDASA